MDALTAAVTQAAYDLDPGRGTSRVLAGAGGGEYSHLHTSPEDVARLLNSLPLAEPHDGAVLSSLRSAVDNARYWQEPDGEDVLVSVPEVREALGRMATALIASACAVGWKDPVDTTGQWAVSFPGTTGSARSTPVNAGEVLEQWHAHQLDEEAVADRERPPDPEARFSGTWWSRPPYLLTRTTRWLAGRGPVGLWLVEDGLGWAAAAARRIRVPGDVRIYEIDGPDAWAELCRRYPLDVTASRRQDWYRTTGRRGSWVIPDWQDVQRDVDAVHVSVAGYLTTAGRAIVVDDDRASVLAGWDPDQTYWFRDVATETATDQEWTYDRGPDVWTMASSR
ncbi:hypothetical protein E3O44_03680 [Cryobacterium algoricola]|uniref:Uncharacterized protein n=1 Tax=Cryobacterium algoricola TaxID=1259183 RepID=A0ABY2IGL2_9MICO|nr:hypothetical protein [Cryobacterium algoricola]TFB90697.1 hypothetical protein E3O44_03680 [Cryobacterium algoricola]